MIVPMRIGTKVNDLFPENKALYWHSILMDSAN